MFNNSLDRILIISKLCLMFQLRSSCFVFLANFRFPFAPFSVRPPNERVTSRDNDILLYSPARCLAISPTKCHPRLRRAVRREAYENVIPSSQSPYRAVPANVVSYFSSSLHSAWVYFQARLHTFCGGMPPAWCTLQPRGDRK